MYCMYVLTIAAMKMFARSRQAVFFTLFSPLIILFFFGFINFDGPMKIDIGLCAPHPTPQTARLVDQISNFQSFSVHKGALDEELAELSKGNRAVVLDVPDDLLPSSPRKENQIAVYINESQRAAGQAAISILDQFADKLTLAAAGAKPVFSIKSQSVTSHHVRYVEFLLPGVIALSIMQMSVFSVAFVFTQYKEKGILKRLLATPMRPYQFVVANIITRLTVATLQTSIFIVVGICVFHIHIVGAYWLLALCVALGSLMFLGLGFTVSGLSKTVDSVPVLANLVVFPMFFLGDVFFSNSNMPHWLERIASFIPLTFLAKSLRAVMTDGAGMGEIKWNLAGMLAWSAALITAATITFNFQERDSV
jgi:ABC-2 type transport system permease protein